MRRGILALTIALCCALLAGCETAASAAAQIGATADNVIDAAIAAVRTPPPGPPPVLPFPTAVQNAVTAVFATASASSGQMLLIDPGIDGATGVQTVATQAMDAQITSLVRERHAQFNLQPFTADTAATRPLVLVSTLTGLNRERKAEGLREVYRVCLALADLRSGTVVGKSTVLVRTAGVDATPTAHFRDAPAWTEDASAAAYAATCQDTQPGAAIPAMYRDRVQVAATLATAMQAYAAGRYDEALQSYEAALRVPEGRQLRSTSGVYIANWRLGRRDAAAQAFDQIVEQGLTQRRLGVKFQFQTGTATLWSDPRSGPAPYPMWLNAIAREASKGSSCLQIVGHTSPSGQEHHNEQLSLRRAEFIKGQLERAAPTLRNKRLFAGGVGSRETLVGNGRDDASDDLDRRVEFKVSGGC